MSIRILPSLAHALSAASDLDAALVALGESLGDVDRSARLAVVSYDARREMLRERRSPNDGAIAIAPVDTTLDHLPRPVRAQIQRGGLFADLGDRSNEYTRLLALEPLSEPGFLALRGLHVDGQLAGILALQEPRRMFGTRVAERFAPAVALFELAYARAAERESRDEAVRTLEEVTQRVHGEYVRKLAAIEAELVQARDAAAQTPGERDSARVIGLERQAADAAEAARRATRRAEAVEHQVTVAVGQLEQAHVELHRRSEALRQKIRTLYLIERVLRLDAHATDPRQLVDGLLALVGDDMQAQRCSLMLRSPDPGALYLAAARGIAPHIVLGARTPLGEGVSGRVAESRQPMLVQDVSEAQLHPLLRDQYFTTGSFISFPLVYHDELVGVVNLTNRARRGVFVEEDVERVRLLALVISLIASNAALPERLLGTLTD